MEATFNPDTCHHSHLAEARNVAREFLVGTLPDVQRVDVTKVAPVMSGDVSWEAEADVWQPNPTLKSLGIETGHPVLDHHRYLVRLDSQLDVLEYELEQGV
jgi:hypothetical protein